MVPAYPLLIFAMLYLRSVNLELYLVLLSTHFTLEKHPMNISAHAEKKLVIVRKDSYICNNDTDNATHCRSFVLPLLK